MTWLNLYQTNPTEFQARIGLLSDEERDAVIREVTLELNTDWLAEAGMDAVPQTIHDHAVPPAPIPAEDPSIADLIDVKELERKTRVRLVTPPQRERVKVELAPDYLREIALHRQARRGIRGEGRPIYVAPVRTVRVRDETDFSDLLGVV